jgi:hypothetical protein
MATTLNDYLKENPGAGFRSVPQYFAEGDFLVYFMKDRPHFAERLDDIVTVYLDLDTKELVGCKVKGVRHILKTADEFGVYLDGDTVRLAFLIFAGAASNQGGRKKEWYAQLRQLKDVTVSRKELCEA